MIPVNVGDILKYMPTSTVGKVTDIRERDGKVWVKLDNTNLYYDAVYVTAADASEYKAVSYKERERSLESQRVSSKTIDDLRKMERDVDISDFTPTGGG